MAKILVVEDEWIVADQICGNLRKIGYLVPPPVSSGDEAIKKIAEEKPDLVIMDIFLRGEMDGVETAKQINLKFDIPIIYLTAYSCSDLLERVKITNPAGYLVKPFEETELKCNIEIALHNHSQSKKLRVHHDSLEQNLKKAIDVIVENI
jgi:CheY-like chemotaxis protein